MNAIYDTAVLGCEYRVYIDAGWVAASATRSIDDAAIAVAAAA